MCNQCKCVCRVFHRLRKIFIKSSLTFALFFTLSKYAKIYMRKNAMDQNFDPCATSMRIIQSFVLQSLNIIQQTEMKVYNIHKWYLL